VWNSLPNDVVEADTINAFKNRLEKYWSNQDVLFHFNVDLIGTGSDVCESDVNMRASDASVRTH